MNQLMLGPVTLSTVFAWNLALTGKAEEIGDKIKRDLFPTIQNGALLASACFKHSLARGVVAPFPIAVPTTK